MCNMKSLVNVLSANNADTKREWNNKQEYNYKVKITQTAVNNAVLVNNVNNAN